MRRLAARIEEALIGIGDEIIATGMARGAAARGKRIGFGDGRKLIWGPWCEQAFRNNPNIARSVNDPQIEWMHYHKGNRVYNRQDASRKRWIWNYEFKAIPGEFFFDKGEREFMNIGPNERAGRVLIEPNVPWHKTVAPNKDWGASRYQAVADELRARGWRVMQTSFGKVRLRDVEVVQVETFREAAASLVTFDLIVVPEGGLHHAAAAVGTKAIVIFGGFIPPQVTGYDMHVNLTGGAEACGNYTACAHCRQALDRISVEEVCEMAHGTLQDQTAAASRRAG